MPVKAGHVPWPEFVLRPRDFATIGDHPTWAIMRLGFRGRSTYPGHDEVTRLGRHSAAERAWREALRLTTARADREFLRRRLAACRPDGGESATE